MQRLCLYRLWFGVLATLLAALCAQSGAAQARALQPIQRQVWTTEDGLPQNSVHAVLQTADGYLWLATEGGVARFDGVRFLRFGTENEKAFSSNDTCCLVQTRDGSLWIGSADGVVRYRDGVFEAVRGVAGGVLGMAASQDGSLLVLLPSGLQRVRSLQTVAVALPGDAEATALGTDGGTTAAGGPLVAAGATVYAERGGGFAPVATAAAAPIQVLRDGAGRLWERTRSAVRVSSAAGERRWALGRDLPGTRLESLSRTADGVLAGTNRGVFLLRVEAGVAVQPVEELAGSAVLYVFMDAEGDRWFGTDSTGLVVLRRRAIGSVPGLGSETVTSVTEASDAMLWVGTRDSGVRLLRGGRVVPPGFAGALASAVVLSLAAGSDGEMWVGTPEGLDHVSGTRVQHLSSADGLPDDFVRSLLVDRDESVWVGTRRGMAHLVDGLVVQVWTAVEGLPSEVIGAMLRASNGDLWIGTLRGLLRLRQGSLKRFGEPEGVRGSVVTALAETPDGVIWVGTRDGGLSARRGERFFAFQSPQLPVQLRAEVDALLPDGRGRLWLRNPLGVARVGVAELERCETQPACGVALRQYGTADGMTSVDSSSDGHPSAWRSRSGLLWFATRRGLSVVDAANFAENRVPPPVVIEQFLVDDHALPLQGAVRIGPGHRRFRVGYAGLSFAAPSQVLYRFKLEGFDRDWVEAGNRRTAEYTNLPPGRYRMLVEARNADGVRSAVPGELRFVIEPPVYRRWWFYALLVLLLGMAVYAVYYLRLRRVRREFAVTLNERNRIAREIHDTLAQDFVAVSLQLEVTSQLLKQSKVEAAREQVDTARQLVREGIREARESIWALRAGGAAESLPARLKTMTEQVQAGGPEGRFSVTGAYRALPAPVEKEMLRVAKEAFGNAAQHAEAAHIFVDLVYLEDAVRLQVRDDGAGFDLAQGSARVGHYGLRGMRERAGAIGAALEIKSAVGEGSSVTLLLRK